MYYVNSSELRSSAWDFDLRLGLIDDVVGNQVHIRETLRVTLSPEHAKALLKLLVVHVKLYELKNGPIPDIDFGLDAREAELMEAALAKKKTREAGQPKPH